MKQPSGKVMGLTGPLASGKSTVAGYLAEWGCPLIDADQLARQAVAPGTPALAKIAETFGSEVLKSDGSLNRPLLAQVVFANPHQRLKLEALVHPLVRTLFLAELKQINVPQPPVKLPVIYVVPLLFETRVPYPEIEQVLVVSAPAELCIRRAMERDAISREQAEQRFQAQLPAAEKERRADLIINNQGSLAELRAKTEEVFIELQRRIGLK